MDLSKILTPSFYDSIVKCQFPWEGNVDMEFASKFFFEGIPDNRRQIFEERHKHALKPLSEWFLANDTLPDLTPYLPDPSHPKYAENTLALILLVDQSPRSLYTRGLDVRWSPMFFDIMSKNVMKDLLDAGVFPDSTAKWMDLGYGFEDAMVRKFWLYAPFIHSEELEDQRRVTAMIERMRVEVEQYVEREDPWRASREEDSSDTGMFRRLILQGPPTTFAEFFFWVLRIFDAHRPIVERFGRFPYNNICTGRDSTPEEKAYLEETRYFHVPRLTEFEGQKLSEQVRKRVWEPLSDRGPW